MSLLMPRRATHENRAVPGNEESEPVGRDVPSVTPRPDRLEIDALEVEYPNFTLGPVTLGLDRAQICCLLGPNGSGKSTLIRTLMGLQAADHGGASWDGIGLADRPPIAFADIGYVTDNAEDVIEEFTAHEYWEYCALAHSRCGHAPSALLERATALAADLDFAPPRRPIRSFSLGMKRKTQLVAGLMHAPGLIVLDEPLIGLDFLAIRALEEVLLAERDRGALVLVSSHDLGVAGRLADRIAVLHLGDLVLDEPLARLAAEGPLESVVERVIRSARGKDTR